MLNKESLDELREKLRHGPPSPYGESWWPVKGLLDHIDELEAVLHDLRLDSDAYRRGWREACQRCFDVASAQSGYPYGPQSTPPETELAIFRFGKILGTIHQLMDKPGSVPKSVVHFAEVPFEAFCGADVPNQRTTQDREHVTCEDCRKAEK